MQPTLTTFIASPSWINRAGSVDRSACLELKASSLRPLAEFRTFSKGKREALSEIAISARFLTQLMDKHLPHQLQGDSRTTKSNAMKDRFLSPSPPGRVARGEGLLSLSSNPNKGATRSKMLGLWETWQQTIRIERHRLHKTLAQHFLLCPTCNNKYLKLFIPLCTQAEALDADTAESWLDQLEEHQRISHTPLTPSFMDYRASLINRYGILFRNERKLVCRKCLGLRYGQVRK